MTEMSKRTVLVLGGTGKTGRRVVAGLQEKGIAVRVGSRSATPRFDWDDEQSWAGALDGVDAVYVSYYPDLLMPEAEGRIGAFSSLAVAAGVKRLVLLSGRGEAGAERCEEAVKATGADWTVIRASWFAQNFDEGVLLEPIRNGEVMLPVGAVGEPFVHADDIAEVAVLALSQDGHSGATYELTGPRLLSFAQAIGEIDAALVHDVRYVQISDQDFAKGLAELPAALTGVLMELFTEILDGRNESVTHDIERLTGHKARDFSTYVRETAATGIWGAAK